MQLPDDPNPDPPGGRSAERLREFIAAHKAPEAVEHEDDEDDERKKSSGSQSL